MLGGQTCRCPARADHVRVLAVTLQPGILTFTAAQTCQWKDTGPSPHGQLLEGMQLSEQHYKYVFN